MRDWQYKGNLALAKSNEAYCLFSQRTPLSNIFSADSSKQASKQAFIYK